MSARHIINALASLRGAVRVPCGARRSMSTSVRPRRASSGRYGAPPLIIGVVLALAGCRTAAPVEGPCPVQLAAYRTRPAATAGPLVGQFAAWGLEAPCDAGAGGLSVEVVAEADGYWTTITDRRGATTRVALSRRAADVLGGAGQADGLDLPSLAGHVRLDGPIALRLACPDPTREREECVQGLYALVVVDAAGAEHGISLERLGAPLDAVK